MEEEFCNDIKCLHGQIRAMENEHAANLMEAHKVTADIVNTKDDMTRNMIKMMMDQYRAIIEGANEKNDKILVAMKDSEERCRQNDVKAHQTIQMMVDQFRGMMKDVNDRNDRQLSRVNKCFKTSEYADTKDFNQFGSSLMEMVNHRQQELHDKYGMTSPLDLPKTGFNDSVVANNFPLIN